MSEVTIPPTTPDPGANAFVNRGGPETSTDPRAAAAHTQSAISLAPAGNYHNGRLTLAGMQQVIARGGSVVHNGNVITRHQDLPNERQLARDNAGADRQALVLRQQTLAGREAQARNAGTYELEKGEFDNEKAAIAREAARINVSTQESEADALADLDRRQEALEAERAQLKAAKAQAPATAKK
jgi:hypothetical protein